MSAGGYGGGGGYGISKLIEFIENLKLFINTHHAGGGGGYGNRDSDYLTKVDSTATDSTSAFNNYLICVWSIYILIAIGSFIFLTGGGGGYGASSGGGYGKTYLI